MEIRKAIAYLKPAPLDHRFGESNEILSKEDQIFDNPFLDGLTATYLCFDEESGCYQYVQHRHLEEERLTKDELHEYGKDNLIQYAMSHQVKIEKNSNGYYFIMLDGTFDASLTLLNGLWEKSIANYVNDGIVVAIPSRDTLIFCDINNKKALKEMMLINKKIRSNCDYPLSDKLLKRVHAKWEYM